MSNQPTPSKPTNHLIEMATQVANGAAPAASFQALLSERIQQSEQNRHTFEERARARGEGFLEAHGALADRVLELMESYENGLLRQADFFETGRPEALLEGNDMLAEAISPLLQALDRYAAAYLDYGPSAYPLMNQVLITLKHIAEGTGELQTFQDIQRIGVEYHQKAIQEIDSSERTKTEGYQAQRKAFEDIIRALQDIEPVDDFKKIDAAVRPLQLALEAKTSADEKIFIEHTSLKPTNMPAANVLINVARGCLEGMYELEQFRDALYWFRSYSEQIEEEFDLAVEGETNSLVILEELPKTREIIDLQAELLDRFEDALDDFCSETVEPLLEELTEVVERFEASSKVFVEAAEREGKLVCVQCGHPNPSSNRTCESCAAKLPQMVDPSMFPSAFQVEEQSSLLEEGDDDYRMGVNTYRLFEAAYHFYEGEIDEDAFRQEIELSRKSVETSESGIASLSAMEISDKQAGMLSAEELQTFRESQEMFFETKHLLEEGIDEWHEGLELFEQYIDNRHRPTLESGIHLIFVASMKIYKVHKLGEMAEKTLAKMQDRERSGPQEGNAEEAEELQSTEAEEFEPLAPPTEVGPDISALDDIPRV